MSRKLECLLSYHKVLPVYLPEFYGYLLTYARGKPVNVEDAFYWERLKFGLKPTLSVAQRSTMRGNASEPIAFAVAENQLYAQSLFRDSTRPHVLCAVREGLGLLSDYAGGFGAGASDGRKRLGRSNSWPIWVSELALLKRSFVVVFFANASASWPGITPSWKVASLLRE